VDFFFDDRRHHLLHTFAPWFHYASITVALRFLLILKGEDEGQPVAAGVLLKGEAACLSRQSRHH
jgi:hypothetical protein